MKPTWFWHFVLCLTPILAQSQSTMEFQSGTQIEVTTGADICADTVLINGSYSGDGTQCGGTLPVELVSMTAKPGKRTVILTWKTATETDNFGFELERRSVLGYMLQAPGSKHEASNWEPKTNWSTISFVAGSGTSTSPKEYSFTDENLPSGRYAYRLKQINQDGTFIYSGSVEVFINAPETFALHTNYPNPFNPATTIEYDLPQEVKVDLIVYDNLGRQVTTLVNGVQPAGYHKVIFETQSLSSGMYYYRMVAGDFVKVKKLLLLK